MPCPIQRWRRSASDGFALSVSQRSALWLAKTRRRGVTCRSTDQSTVSWGGLGGGSRSRALESVGRGRLCPGEWLRAAERSRSGEWALRRRRRARAEVPGQGGLHRGGALCLPGWGIRGNWWSPEAGWKWLVRPMPDGRGLVSDSLAMGIGVGVVMTWTSGRIESSWKTWVLLYDKWNQIQIFSTGLGVG